MARVIEAVNVILRRLGSLPDCPKVRELREKGLDYINEAVMWKTAMPPVEERDSLMKRVLALHVEARKVGECEEPPG